jgi:hypothetical protein
VQAKDASDAWCVFSCQVHRQSYLIVEYPNSRVVVCYAARIECFASKKVGCDGSTGRVNLRRDAIVAVQRFLQRHRVEARFASTCGRRHT